jgi:hypothetical protein
VPSKQAIHNRHKGLFPETRSATGFGI